MEIIPGSKNSDLTEKETSLPPITKLHRKMKAFLGRTFTPTLLPNYSIVTSQIHVNSQSILIAHKDIEAYYPYIDKQRKDYETGKQSDKEFITALARLCPKLLPEGIERWYTQKDHYVSLGECIGENTNTCFHRGLFFQLMMQYVDIPARTVEGKMILSARDSLEQQKGIPKEIIPNPLGHPFFISREDRIEEHIWNLIYFHDSFYLVDTAYTAPNGAPIVFQLLGKDTGDIVLASDHEGNRHYIEYGEITTTQFDEGNME